MTGQGARHGPGWQVFDHDPDIAAWAAAALEPARAATADPDLRARWLDCDGTWFVGVDALPNTPDGAIADTPLAGKVIDHLRPLPPLHPAQLSVTYPGYPRPRRGEGEAAFRYRLRRDAAHVDGITRHGPDRRRCVTEPHAFILGLPLTLCDPGASPLVVWEGSHGIMREALAARFAGVPEAERSEADVTETYQAARRRCFETCRRVEIMARPGEAILLHRLLLHGVAPWRDGAKAPPEGRMIAYFRPQLPGGISEWLSSEN